MKKIIIVEDDAVVGLVYRTGLAKEGFDVEVVTDGAAGFLRIQETCPAGVLLDLMLPKMSGVEVLKKMRVQPQLAKIPVIAFTNAHLPAMINAAMEAGATKVLNKVETIPHNVIEAFKDAGCFAKDV
jgi:CheY-like chemotaxis protein